MDHIVCTHMAARPQYKSEEKIVALLLDTRYLRDGGHVRSSPIATLLLTTKHMNT